MRTLLVLGLMFLGCALAVAGEEDDVRAAADAVVAAAKDGDAATLKQVAAAKKPTVWFVLDELCARGAYDAADALAAAAPEAMRKPLAAYAEAQRKVPTPMAHRETYVQFRKAMQAGNLEAALAIEVVPTEPPSVVAVRFLGLRGQALARHRKPAESMQALGQAGQLADDLGWAAESLKLYYEAGMMAARRQDLAGCETYWRPAYAAAKKLGSLPYQAEVGARLAIVLSQRTRNEEALAINREVMPLFVRMGNKSAVASLQMNMGTSLMILGRLEEALEILTKARTALIEAKDARLLAMLTGNMSALYTRLGDYDRALKMKQDALARHRAMGMELEASRILSGMGDHYRQLAEYALAFDYYEQALAGHRKLDNKQGIGFTLGRMGLAHAQLGDGEKARELLQQGLVALDEVGAERIAMHLRSDLADLHTVEGDYEEALALKKEILAAREASGNLTYISDAHQTIATTYGYMGRLEEGLKHVAKALDFAKRAKNDASIAYARICYADLYGRQGKFEKALPHFEATLAYAKEHDDARLENAVYETRVEAAITAKKHGEAVTAALAAADALRRQFRNLGHEERARAGERWVKALVLGVASARHAKDPKAAFRLLEASRASALREALGGGTAIRAAAIPAELRREGAQAAAAEAAAADRLRAATARRTSLKKLRELKKELAAARSRMEAVAVKTERAAKAAANVVQPQPATLADCQRLLGKDRVLVLFTSQGEEASALVVRKKSIRHIPLGPAEKIRDACNRLHADTQGTLDEKATEDLRRLVLEPLKLKSGDRKLWISPDGALAYVPFSLLLPKADLTFVPSGSTAVQLADQAQVRGEGVLALGDPRYSSRPIAAMPGRLRSGFKLAPLPASGDEAKAVGDVVLLGEEATEAKLAEAISKRERWRAVHFACHGLVDPQRPSFCSLALTPAEGSDGFLTALEILRSDIPADLVVLSACETGRGKVYDGEGIVGLAGAFMVAGAPRVLASLWKVDDEATRALMEAFHAKWKAGAPAAAALRQAQEHVRTIEKSVVDREASRKARRTVMKKTRPWKDPRYWAGWVLWGGGE